MKYLLGLLLVSCISCSKIPMPVFHIGDCLRSKDYEVYVVIDIGQYAYKIRSYKHPKLIHTFDFTEQSNYTVTDCFVECD